MSNPTAIIKFLFSLMQWGGLVIAGMGVFAYVMGRSKGNDEMSSNSIWIIVGGIAAFAIGSFLATQTIPTLG